MVGLKHIAKIREYCDYVEEHLDNVSTSWDIIQDKCKDMNIIYDDFLFFNIDQHIKNHDISKLSHAEFIPYVEKFFPMDDKNADSNELFTEAWENHQDYNQHHWQNWTNVADHFPNEWACHCTCMVVDWMAMAIKFNDTAQGYYENNKDSIDIPEKAVKFIYEIFEKLDG